MKTLEATILVDDEHRATLQLPVDVPPGLHRIVFVIEEPSRVAPATEAARPTLTFSAHDTGPWPEGFTVRREEIYDDGGR